MRTTVIIGWVCAIGSLLAIAGGHLGTQQLSWKANQISTYAATAPYDYFITLSMLLSTVSLLVVGVLVSKHRIIGDSYLAHIIPLLAGAAASGLIMLACFEETAKSLKILKHSGFWAIRVQSFHDAGLLIFFYSSLVLTGLLGIAVFINRKSLIDKVFGGCMFLSPLSFLLMTTPWPQKVGFVGNTIGINQRAGLFCLWLAVVFLLSIASKKAIFVDSKSRAVK